MKVRGLKRTDLKVSAVCMGTGNFGEKLQEKEARYLLDTFVDAGGNFIDTANVYCRWVAENGNTSEQIIGKWLKDRGRRDDVIIATKGGHYDFKTPTISRVRKEEIRKDLEESLRTLGLDTIPLYYLHRDDICIPIDEILGWMEEFVALGLIQYYAASNFKKERMIQAELYRIQNNWQGFSALSNQWSYAKRNLWNQTDLDPTLVMMQDEDIAWFCHTGLPLIPYTSTAQGFFEKLDKGTLSESMKQTYLNDENLMKYDILKQERLHTGISLYQLSIKKLMEQPFQVIPLGSFRTVEQLNEFISVAV